MGLVMSLIVQTYPGCEVIIVQVISRVMTVVLWATS